ncbi:MAG: 4-phosphoerythronate dehydrogenase, partial [Muribaculaceae bacterium]|nr:4-phosphoerythronate dehydrogenase [Muribaculaceae bacterium]
MPNSYIRLIVEKNIPFVKGLLDQYATIRYLDPEEITPKAVRECDGLMIRTRTQCDAELLAKSEVKMIATATIGTDHIDLDYCAGRSITVTNAPGCNAPAVAQYVFASLLHTVNRPLAAHTIAIVGVGHVGSIVARWAKGFDMKVMLCDPFRQEAEGGDGWYSLDEVAAKADIITFHTPLTDDGEHPTCHMADAEFFAKCRRMPIIINTSRGPVIDTVALKEAKKAGQVGPLIIDCWENEPAIDLELLHSTAIATPHIAGYSAEGKKRASQLALDAITTFFMLPRVSVEGEIPPAPAVTVSKSGVLGTYDPTADSKALKAHPEDFEKLRNTYRLRTEVPEGHD